MLWLLGLILLIWAITHFYLRGEDLSAYDQPRPASMSGDAPPSEGLRQAEKVFQDLFKSTRKGDFAQLLAERINGACQFQTPEYIVAAIEALAR